MISWSVKWFYTCLVRSHRQNVVGSLKFLVNSTQHTVLVSSQQKRGISMQRMCPKNTEILMRLVDISDSFLSSFDLHFSSLGHSLPHDGRCVCENSVKNFSKKFFFSSLWLHHVEYFIVFNRKFTSLLVIVEFLLLLQMMCLRSSTKTRWMSERREEIEHFGGRSVGQLDRIYEINNWNGT